MEQMYKTANEGMRQLLEIAICCGRCWQSPQTGYIHYCYTKNDENSNHTIPTFENFTFALALLRSRNADNINDAKELLRRLLHFQSSEGEMSGNFPIYLHEYPYCKDRLHGIHLLVPLYWIYKNFHHVLGADIKQQLKAALIRLQNYCLQTLSVKPAPYHIALKAAACAKAAGPLLDQGEIVKKGELLFNELQKVRDKVSLYSPAALSDLIQAHQILDLTFSNESDKAFLDHLASTWHMPTCSYCGPGWKEFQRGGQPQVTFYDFFMGYVSGTYSFRCFTDHPVQLQAALVHPIEERLTAPTYPLIKDGMLNGLPWEMQQHKNIAFTVMGKENSAITIQERSFSSLKLLWGCARYVHSLICQGGTSQGIDYTIEGDTIVMDFAFSDSANVDDNEKNQEVSFYLDEYSETSISVEGQAATTFKMGEEVIITSGTLRLALSFHLGIGYGEFFGHIMKSNRPSQLSVTGKNRFDVYDWQIFLRTIQRSDECTIQAKLRILSE